MTLGVGGGGGILILGSQERVTCLFCVPRAGQRVSPATVLKLTLVVVRGRAHDRNLNKYLTVRAGP